MVCHLTNTIQYIRKIFFRVVEEQTRVICELEGSVSSLEKLVKEKNENQGTQSLDKGVGGTQDPSQTTPILHDHHNLRFEGDVEMNDRIKAEP